ncbi:MAG: hypothetical protein ABIP97_11570 [Chthoniobacterales bacterium]
MRFLSRAAFLCALHLLITPLHAADKASATPNLCQTDPDGKFAGDGSQFCAPVSVSNSFIWLSQNGYPALDPSGRGDKSAQLEMVRTLSSEDYLNTSTGNGTNPKKVLNGVTTYLTEFGLHAASLKYEGWREVPQEFLAGEYPDLSQIKNAIAKPGGIVWLNIGWYHLEGSQYIRHGGHWVTLVGMEADNALLIHNPAPKASREGDTVYAKRIEDGTLASGKETVTGLPRVAKGYYQITGALPMGTTTIAILDGAIILQMPPTSAPASKASASAHLRLSGSAQ